MPRIAVIADMLSMTLPWLEFEVASTFIVTADVRIDDICPSQYAFATAIVHCV
jgi:hypothetical protein